MVKWDNLPKEFFAEWFETLMKSIEKNVDPKTRLKIFNETGTFCAKAHVTALFKEIKTQSNDISELIAILNEKLKGTTWELLDGKKIKVTYERCFCPLVNAELHNQEVQCDCSIGWLKKNLEILFNKEVEIELKESVLRGSNHCEFLVDY
ncbi:MAG: hypothetical protein FK734_18815 [Asgard group archaeon]|nr:hypothetical protein [Asgard group archaeon]